MGDKYVKIMIFLEFQRKVGDSTVWKGIINHWKYIKTNLKWCIEMEQRCAFGYIIGFRAFCFFCGWNNLECINLNTKVYDFINYVTKE